MNQSNFQEKKNEDIAGHWYSLSCGIPRLFTRLRQIGGYFW